VIAPLLQPEDAPDRERVTLTAVELETFDAIVALSSIRLGIPRPVRSTQP
jgi:hypothetical protein